MISFTVRQLVDGRTAHAPDADVTPSGGLASRDRRVNTALVPTWR